MLMDKTQLTARVATVDDIPLIRDIAWKTFPETYKDILTPQQSDYMMEWMYSPESLLKQIAEEGHHFILAYKGDACLGYVSVERQGDTLFHLQKIYVLPTAQGLGAGQFLFGQAKAYVKSVCPEPCRMELNVNRYNKALHFYERMGMRRDREGDFPIGNGYYMNDYIMVIDL